MLVVDHGPGGTGTLNKQIRGTEGEGGRLAYVAWISVLTDTFHVCTK